MWSSSGTDGSSNLGQALTERMCAVVYAGSALSPSLSAAAEDLITLHPVSLDGSFKR